MKTLIINQFWLNSLLKTIQNIAKNWMSKLSPNENLNNKNNKYNLWDGSLIKNLQVAIYFY